MVLRCVRVSARASLILNTTASLARPSMAAASRDARLLPGGLSAATADHRSVQGGVVAGGVWAARGQAGVRSGVCSASEYAGRLHVAWGGGGAVRLPSCACAWCTRMRGARVPRLAVTQPCDVGV